MISSKITEKWFYLAHVIVEEVYDMTSFRTSEEVISIIKTTNWT